MLSRANGGPGGACVAKLRAFDEGAAPFERLNLEAGGRRRNARASLWRIRDRAHVTQLAAEERNSG